MSPEMGIATVKMAGAPILNVLSVMLHISDPAADKRVQATSRIIMFRAVVMENVLMGPVLTAHAHAVAALALRIAVSSAQGKLF